MTQEDIDKFVASLDKYVVQGGDKLMIVSTDEIRTKLSAWMAEHQGKPIDMILYCPNCGTQHIDEPEDHDEYVEGVAVGTVRLWDNPPHRSHLCHVCGCIWRPADVATNGVSAIQTRGKNDSQALAHQESPAPVSEPATLSSGIVEPGSFLSRARNMMMRAAFTRTEVYAFVQDAAAQVEELEKKIFTASAELAAFNTHHCEFDGCALEGHYHPIAEAWANKFHAMKAELAAVKSQLAECESSNHAVEKALDDVSYTGTYADGVRLLKSQLVEAQKERKKYLRDGIYFEIQFLHNDKLFSVSQSFCIEEFYYGAISFDQIIGRFFEQKWAELRAAIAAQSEEPK